MSITDELREWGFGFCGDTHDVVTAIADRIDAKHERLMREAWDNGYEADFNGIEKWLAEHPRAMELHGWVRLPTDINDEVIHVGDEMTDGEHRFTAYCLSLTCGTRCWTVENERGAAWACVDVHHYHAPTLEDVLLEALSKATFETEAGRKILVDEYAPKVREVLGVDDGE